MFILSDGFMWERQDILGRKTCSADVQKVKNLNRHKNWAPYMMHIFFKKNIPTSAGQVQPFRNNPYLQHNFIRQYRASEASLPIFCYVSVRFNTGVGIVRRIKG